VKLKKTLIYLAIACCNGTGDVMLKRGMDNIGQIHLANWTHIFNAFIDPWVIFGIMCLAGFFYAYLTALSWADLTYVLPATAFGYVVTAFLSRFFCMKPSVPGDGPAFCSSPAAWVWWRVDLRSLNAARSPH